MTTQPITPGETADALDLTVEQWAEQLGLRERAVLTTSETAELLRLSERKTGELIKDGTIPSIRYGHRVRVPVPALLRQMLEETNSAA